MTFLPHDDVEFLSSKALIYELKDVGGQRGIVFPGLSFEGNLYCTNEQSQLVRCVSCDVLIRIPSGYATTKLDSFYTSPVLRRPDNSFPNCATGEETHFGRQWQFWSRHLDNSDWRPDIDGLHTFLNYVWNELRRA
ncbi:hypothetical protein HYPDE_26813 [Hyphomicrobium denitrificans 1NES1]|uniref:Uncharacterized protein n=1 Tax=Hyphomicrobium denitrificans 1NES1 TaxID=670307 RepID=N0B283_9HYPH|nr:E2/UBC family protein [Hyphomicrobium denitrificans]AGK57043.1 hypothetical protein HYPDE_26813 [Hyphomicrobium denitrificans 1NES1]